MTEWYEGLDADHQATVAAKGWNKPLTPEIAVAIAQAHRAAEKHIGVPADQLLRLPKDATDPAYQGIYDRVVGMAVPKDAAGYTFDDVRFKDGTPLDDADKKFVADLALANKLTPTAARAVAAAFASRADMQVADDGAKSALLRQSNNVALRQAWGADYDQKAFAASKVIDAAGLPKAVLDFVEGLPAPDYIQAMNGLTAMSGALNEAAMLRGGRTPDPNAGLTPQAAQERLTALQSDPKWAAAYWAGEAGAREVWAQLTSIIAKGRVA